MNMIETIASSGRDVHCRVCKFFVAGFVMKRTRNDPQSLLRGYLINRAQWRRLTDCLRYASSSFYSMHAS